MNVLQSRHFGVGCGKGEKGIIARFVPEITLSRVRLCNLGCPDLHITCPRNIASPFEVSGLWRRVKDS